MPTYDENSAECLVFTKKEGLLSKIAHDLKVRVTRFKIEFDDTGSSLSAEFDTESLRVVNALREGQEDPGALSAGDKDKIAGNIVNDVLHAKRFPRASFRAGTLEKRADGGYDIRGQLELHGTTKELEASSRLQDGTQVVEIPLHQPDFGITPYKAMMGTLKVQAGVTVQLRVPSA